MRGSDHKAHLEQVDFHPPDSEGQRFTLLMVDEGVNIGVPVGWEGTLFLYLREPNVEKNLKVDVTIEKRPYGPNIAHQIVTYLDTPFSSSKDGL